MLKNLNEFIKWLDGYINFERRPCAEMLKLKNIEWLCEKLGHPERDYKVAHVAGSKGKGSTSRMLAEIIAAETGKTVGVYASPHLVDFRERVSSTDGFFDDSIYLAAADRLMRVVEEADGPATENLTWFELVTAFAFLTFQEAGVDWAVLEVGMGGRLDVTNVVRPEICLITALELEHCEFLGNSIADIAREKGGIIKPGVPVVVAKQKDAETYDVLKEIARERGAELYLAQEIDANAIVGMRGAVQRDNAATAATAARVLGINEEAVAAGLERAYLPGRFEVRELGNGAQLVMDAAHTVKSIEGLMETWREFTYGRKPKYLLLALVADKNAEEIVPLCVGFDKIFVTRPGDFKKSDLPRLRKALYANGIKAVVDEDYKKFIPEVIALAEEQSAMLLATGSFYLLGEIAKMCYNISHE